jgi:methionyl-tRNA formyltransferase
VRIIYAGSPGIAVPALEAVETLSLSGALELAGLLTNPDSPRGRHGKSETTETGAAALRLSAEREKRGRAPLAVLKPERLDAGAREAVEALKPDLLVSFAYGRIFGPRFLALFPLGGINIHPSLLPAYRGPTPIPQAILNRDAETGITIQTLAAEMDGGDILVQEKVPLAGRETSESLGKTMAAKAAELLPGLLRDMAAKQSAGEKICGRPQDHAAATFCSLLSKEDGHIDWNRSAAAIDAAIRAFTPWPLSYTEHKGRRLYILEALPLNGADGAHPALPPAPPSALPSALPGAVLGVDKQRGILVQTGDGVLLARLLQYEAGKALEWRAFLNGARDFTGSRLGI